ncbi:MAG: hypothetical protein V1769_04135 [Thermoplasmatota archaeon]
MVREDMEELKKFGAEIQHTSKHGPIKNQAASSTSIMWRRCIQIFYRTFSFFRFLLLVMYRKVRKAIHRMKWSLKQLHFNSTLRVQGPHHHCRKEVTLKHATRLIETKKQIGDVTVIIRKRIEVPLNDANQFNRLNGTRVPASYFFHTRSTLMTVEKPYSQHESLFDMPMPLHRRRSSLREKMKLFFLRW